MLALVSLAGMMTVEAKVMTGKLTHQLVAVVFSGSTAIGVVAEHAANRAV